MRSRDPKAYDAEARRLSAHQSLVSAENRISRSGVHIATQRGEHSVGVSSTSDLRTHIQNPKHPDKRLESM